MKQTGARKKKISPGIYILMGTRLSTIEYPDQPIRMARDTWGLVTLTGKDQISDLEQTGAAHSDTNAMSPQTGRAHGCSFPGALPVVSGCSSLTGGWWAGEPVSVGLRLRGGTTTRVCTLETGNRSEFNRRSLKGIFSSLGIAGQTDVWRVCMVDSMYIVWYVSMTMPVSAVSTVYGLVEWWYWHYKVYKVLVVNPGNCSHFSTPQFCQVPVVYNPNRLLLNRLTRTGLPCSSTTGDSSYSNSCSCSFFK